MISIRTCRCLYVGRRTVSQLRWYSAPAEDSVPPSKQKYIPCSGEYPLDFLVSAVHVGVKASNTSRNDLALIASERPCHAAAVFTKNLFQAAPITVSKGVLQKREGQRIRAVIVNSGCANAVTGKGGIEDAEAMGEAAKKSLHEHLNEAVDPQPNTVVMSTGVIGQRLPITKITNKIPDAVSALDSSHESWLSVARAICTTDTFPKLVSRTFTLPSYPGITFRIAGMAKGAGMIHPNMGTLLSIIATDAPIHARVVQNTLLRATNASFNSISIDGDTSTNDTVALLANGAACPPNAHLVEDENGPDADAFREVLKDVATQLAHLIVRDGEGATKFVTIRVLSPSRDDQGSKAMASVRSRVANAIARSPLVKTALYGKDANWGRILCAIGYAMPPSDDVGRFHKKVGSGIVPELTSVSFVPPGSRIEDETGDVEGELELVVNGEPRQVDEEWAAKLLAEDDIEILVRLRPKEELTGGKAAEKLFWTCDFSHEYVTINGDYRT